MSDKRYLGNIITPTPTAPAGAFQDDAAPGVWSLQEAYTYIKAGAWPTAGNQLLLIEDVFSTYLYTGTNTTNPIANGIDLANEGGMVWLKWRGGSGGSGVYDTERGVRKYLETYSTSAQSTAGVGAGLTTFNSDGFTLGTSWNTENFTNYPYVSWTFRKAPRFFDVVTYTGDGTNPQTINHNLGVEPGCIIIKRTDGTTNWQVYHRGLNSGVNPEQYGIQLNLTNAQGGDFWNDTAPTSTEFTVSGSAQVGGSGLSYVAYLFAHDPLGPSGDGSDGLIACGVASYPVSGDVEVDLGWEPQWVLLKDQNHAGQPWWIIDTTRGWAAQKTSGTLSSTTGGNWQALFAESSGAEVAYTYGGLTSTGFKLPSNNNYGDGNTNYIYIAIRRGPMREPTSGTDVFYPQYSASGLAEGTKITTGFPVDMQIQGWTGSGPGKNFVVDRLRGVQTTATNVNTKWLKTHDTASEDQGFFTEQWDNTGYGVPQAWAAETGLRFWNFRRAPGFFDVVAYTGDGTFDGSYNVSHSLGVTPEMIITKSRSNSDYWSTYHSGLTSDTYQVQLNLTLAQTNTGQSWGPSPTSFKPQYAGNTNYSANVSGRTYIAYLFATLPGVSKVGSYTGNGTSQTIDCGFTSGARFILIKRTDSTGDWYVWDTARGIVTGNDPHLSLNTTAAEVTSDDSIDPDSSGFIVNQVAATNINVSAASYIFYSVS